MVGTQTDWRAHAGEAIQASASTRRLTDRRAAQRCRRDRKNDVKGSADGGTCWPPVTSASPSLADHVLTSGHREADLISERHGRKSRWRPQ